MTIAEELYWEESQSKPLLPFLKWAGGKARLARTISEFAPISYERYIEPFAGAAALFFHLRPREALLSDLNEELMMTYRVVQNKVSELVALLSDYPHSREFFHQLRGQDPGLLDPVERAARLIYLNRTCYNGLYRVNRKNQFNVPFGQYKNPTICDVGRLTAASEALRGVRVECGDYYELLEYEARTGDFIYFDPPYQPVGKYADFKRYTSAFFNEQDQERLADLIGRLVQRGCSVLASNSDTDFVRSLYRTYEIVSLQARRHINCRGEGRGPVGEVLIVCRS